MDGLNISLNVLQLIQQERNKSTLGHVAFILYNAFKTGAEQTDWKMKMIVKTADQIFHGSSVRREDYFTITGSN